ncbi:MAG TPA: divalent metal cation transporter [Thermoanaerobaculia bacterium]|nr:divalent metal cation transporter [Thermoanaerobaculia bacterium]
MPRPSASDPKPADGPAPAPRRPSGAAASAGRGTPGRSLRRFFAALGPGVITGAADDDPSGIATYSIAGAQLGTSLLWTAALTWPLMAAVQMMCARIGMVTGEGLAGALGKKFPRPFLVGAAIALLLANTINIAADLSAMADSAEMLSGINSHYFVVVFGAGIAVATVRLHYYQIAAILKWLALVLFAYVVTAFLVHPRWSAVLHDTFIPGGLHGSQAWATLVAILGTTISPYLFFWQASQEVEEEKAKGRRMLVQRRSATRAEIVDRKLDVGVGTFFSNAAMFFIILVTALTLHAHGLTHIETSRQAAEALRPLAGDLAYTLYTVGILGVGFLAIPTLAGSAAYAFAETFRWRHGLNQKLAGARRFYVVILLSTAAGIALDFAHVNPIQALFWTAVINGLLAPFLMVGILIVASDRRLMNGQPSSWLGRVAVGAATALMFIAAIGMFVFQ